jgi:hypothetical protein
MKTNNITIVTIILVIVTFVQVLYFLNTESELRKERVDYVVSHEGNQVIKISSLILLLFLAILLFIISCFIENFTRVNRFAIFAFIIITITNYAECKLKTNVHFSNVTKDLDTALDESTTGDFVLFRTYHAYDIPNLFLFRYFVSLYSTVYFNHIGMIMKDGNETYIVENVEEKVYCLHHKYIKPGPVIVDAKKRIKEYEGRVYLSKNNLHQFIDSSQIYENFKKYESYNYLQNGIMCVHLISNILSDLGVMVRPSILYLMHDFIQPQNYKVNFKNIESVKVHNDFVDTNGI